MIYHPYFRGKQNELVCIRDCAELISIADFRPIIEPVKSTTGSLIRCLEELTDKNAGFLLVANPYFGDFKRGISDDLLATAREIIQRNQKAGWAFILGQDESVDTLIEWLRETPATAVVHGGGHSGNVVSDALANANTAPLSNIFIESVCGKLYRNHFKENHRVLIRDGFQRRNNKSHPDVESFSDLHLTFTDEGMDGFGDFSIVGDEYLESGGPAYAVALHVTFIDDDQDSSMFIHHFKSDTNDSPIDPGNKFREAVTKLRAAVEARDSKILRTKAIETFLTLQENEHYPGLGYAKKISMQHHLELMSTIL